MQTAEYEITRVFDAERDEVFKAWTDPARFADWFNRQPRLPQPTGPHQSDQPSLLTRRLAARPASMRRCRSAIRLAFTCSCRCPVSRSASMRSPRDPAARPASMRSPATQPPAPPAASPPDSPPCVLPADSPDSP
jgi:hypothetical protein